MERFDLYDKDLNKLNKTMIRGESNLTGEYHLVTHIWIRNSKNQYLIQQRNKADDLVPYQWAATGGAITAGETVLDGTLREVEEELGIRLQPENLQLVQQYHTNSDVANYITYLYLVEVDLPLEDCRLDPVEVRAVKYATMPEIKEMILRNVFWDYARLTSRLDYFDSLEKSER